MRVVSLPAACAFLVLLVSAPVLAQTYPVTGPIAVPYEELGPTATQAPANYNDDDWCCSSDMWNVALPTGFTFRYFGSTYSHLGISGNGGIVPLTSASPGTSANYYVDTSNDPFPSTLGPQGIIAPWWDDFARSATLSPHPGGLFFEVIGTAPNRVLKVQWKNLTHYYCTSSTSSIYNVCSTTRSYSFQAWIVESNGTDNSAIIFSYGTPIGPDGTPNGGNESGYNGSISSSYPSGSVGLENQAESEGVTVLSCTPNCEFDFDFPAQQLFVLGSFNQPELLPQVSVPSYQSSATELQLGVQGTVYNVGTVGASGIGWDVYLSNDRVLDPATDISVGAVAPTLSVGPTASVGQLANLVIPRPPDGAWYVCIDVDPTNAVVERLDGNNRSCSPTPLLVGTELQGAISLPPLGAPGEDVEIPIQIRNVGSDATASFQWRIYFSADEEYNLGDELMHSGTRSLGGSEVWNSVQTVRVPRLIPGNRYYAILQVDAGNAIAEIDENNNISVSSNDIELIKPELRPEAVTPDFGFGCYFGQPFSIEFTVCNSGFGTARNFVNSVALSDNYVVSSSDLELDADPQSCLGGTDAECRDLGGGQPFCYLGTCHAPCETDLDCGGSGLVCRADPDLPLMFSCQNVVGPGECQVSQRNITMPTTDLQGAPLEEGEYYLGVIADSTDAVNEENEGNQIGRYAAPILCRYPAMDFAPVAVVPQAQIAAGEVTSIFRVIRNLGNVEGTVSYRYYLSSNEAVTSEDIALEVESNGGVASDVIGSFAESNRTDLVLVPDNVAPGEYYLGIMLDPDHELNELDRSNNSLVTSHRIVVAPAALRIVTSTLPDSTVGSLYRHQLVAAGGAGAYEWTLTEGALPPGLSMDASGAISGTPIDETTAVFGVKVTNGNVTAKRLLALRVGPPMGSLAVTTRTLPPAVVGEGYSLQLTASGGMPPYSWTLLGSAPAGLVVTPSGVFEGVPAVITPEPAVFAVEVQDARGNRAGLELSLMVVSAADLFITSQRFEQATAGEEYLDCVSATGGDGEYAWTTESGIPAGLAEEQVGNKLCLTGTPLACGSFSVVVGVVDGTGQSDTADLPFTVECDRVGLTTRSLPAVQRGDAVEMQLESNAGEGARYRLYAGRMPSGLTLSEAGLLEGTVAGDASLGAHNFVVEIQDEVGGYGLSALAVEVLADPWEPPPAPETKDGGGCSAAGTAPAAALPWLAVLLGLCVRRRR